MTLLDKLLVPIILMNNKKKLSTNICLQKELSSFLSSILSTKSISIYLSISYIYILKWVMLITFQYYEGRLMCIKAGVLACDVFL